MTTMARTVQRQTPKRALVDELSHALRRRIALVAQLNNGRSPAKTALWLLGCSLKALIAMATLGFILFTVDLPASLVMASFLLPLAVVFAAVVTRWLCLRRVARRARVERERHLQCEQARALAEARLALLQTGIDPDFLFNNLAILQHLMRKDRIKADFMLSQLVQYLRLSSTSLRSDNSSLGAQMDLVDAYLQLASIRMGKRIFVQVSCPPELKSIPFPPMVIHALVENALRHGVDPCLTSVMVQVRAYVMSDRLIVDIQDDGVGLGHASAAPLGRGLRNIRSRLCKVYGPMAKLSVVNQTSRGVLSRIEIEQPDLSEGLSVTPAGTP